MPFWSLEPCSRGICTTIQEGFKLPGPEWVKLEPCICMTDDSVQVGNADAHPRQRSTLSTEAPNGDLLLGGLLLLWATSHPRRNHPPKMMIMTSLARRSQESDDLQWLIIHSFPSHFIFSFLRLPLFGSVIMSKPGHIYFVRCIVPVHPLWLSLSGFFYGYLFKF